MHDPRDGRAVLGADDQDVPAVAIGDDLLLQILRRVLAAQVGFERPAKTRALLPQAFAQVLQFGARLVDHLAGRIDLAAHVGDLALERPGRLDDRAEPGEPCPVTADAGHRRFDGREERGESEQVQRLERASVDSQRRQDGVDLRGRAERDVTGTRQEARRFRGGLERGRNRARIIERMQPRERLRPGRRLREAADSVDDAIEFEGLEGARVHG
jgi:hypothetical protein